MRSVESGGFDEIALPWPYACPPYACPIGNVHDESGANRALVNLVRFLQRVFVIADAVIEAVALLRDRRNRVFLNKAFEYGDAWFRRGLRRRR